jgi:hypothetical protein
MNIGEVGSAHELAGERALILDIIPILGGCGRCGDSSLGIRGIDDF